MRSGLLAAGAAGAAVVAAVALWLWPVHRLDAAQAGTPAAVPVDVVTARQQPVAETETFTTRLEARDLVELRPRVAGPVETVHVADGQAVARGALLFTIDRRPFEAELARAAGALTAARSQSALAQKELARARQLLPEQASSQQEVDQLAAAAEAAAAAVQQADAALRTARLDLEHTQVRAPIGGRLSRIDVTRGNLVDDQRVLSVLVGTGRVHAWFDVSEDTFLRLRRDARAQRSVRMGLADEAGLPRTGRVDAVDNRLNPQTGTLRVRAVFDDPDGALLPGMQARLQLEVTPPRPAVVVPDRAIVTDQDRKLVWVVGADGLPQPRPVTLGPLVDGMRVLRDGVAAGEDVVVGGLQRVRPGQPVAPQRLATDARGLPLPPAPAPAPAQGARS